MSTNVPICDLVYFIVQIEKIVKKHLGIIFGPINVGKGTQAEKLSTEFGFYHLTTGGLIRNRIEKDKDDNLKKIIDSGKLISDELMYEILKDKLEELSHSEYELVLLDGIPRTIKQVEQIKRLEVDLNYNFAWSIWLDAPLEVLVERAKHRVIAPDGTVYNLKFNPPPKEVALDKLKRREDDSLEVISKRYEIYLKDTLPCIRSEFILSRPQIKINASPDIEKVYFQAKEFILGQKLS